MFVWTYFSALLRHGHVGVQGLFLRRSSQILEANGRRTNQSSFLANVPKVGISEMKYSFMGRTGCPTLPSMKVLWALAHVARLFHGSIVLHVLRPAFSRKIEVQVFLVSRRASVFRAFVPVDAFKTLCDGLWLGRSGLVAERHVLIPRGVALDGSSLGICRTCRFVCLCGLGVLKYDQSCRNRWSASNTMTETGVLQRKPFNSGAALKTRPSAGGVPGFVLVLAIALSCLLCVVFSTADAACNSKW